jgi:hypothetical protein
MHDAYVSLSGEWDPRDPSSSIRPPGDVADVLTGLDNLLDHLLAEPASKSATAVALGAKAITLNLLGRPQEMVVAAFERAIESAEDPKDVPWILAASRALIGRELAYRGQLTAAEQALSDVVAFYGADDDPTLRAVAVGAIADRIRALSDLGDVDRIRDAWASARVEYSAETDPRIRANLAETGRSAAHALFQAGRAKDALTTADEVIRRYQTDNDAMIRPHVAAAMMVRLVALPRWRIRTRRQTAQDLFHYAGDTPEPEVIEALNETNRRMAWLVLRLGHDERHHHKHDKEHDSTR